MTAFHVKSPISAKCTFLPYHLFPVTFYTVGKTWRHLKYQTVSFLFSFILSLSLLLYISRHIEQGFYMIWLLSLLPSIPAPHICKRRLSYQKYNDWLCHRARGGGKGVISAKNIYLKSTFHSPTSCQVLVQNLLLDETT